MSHNLMIVCAGDKSVHLENLGTRDDLDVWTIYYGDNNDVARRFEAVSDRFWQAKGLKIELLRKFIVNEVYFKQKFRFTAYRYVFIPDDDIVFDEGSSIEKFLRLCEITNADMAQPSIHNKYWSHVGTRQVANIAAHTVNWIEIMMPALRSDVFENAFVPVVHEFDFMTSGFAIEIMIQKLAESYLRRPTKNVVFDCCPVLHSRPVGSNGRIHRRGELEAFFIPQRNWMFGMETLREFDDIETLSAWNDEDVDRLFFDRERIEKALRKYETVVGIARLRRNLMGKLMRRRVADEGESRPT